MFLNFPKAPQTVLVAVRSAMRSCSNSHSSTMERRPAPSPSRSQNTSAQDHQTCSEAAGPPWKSLWTFRRRCSTTRWQGENNQGVALPEAKHRVAASSYGDILHTGDLVGDRRRVDPGAALEAPEQLAALGIKGIEIAVSFTCKHQAARRGEDPSDHGLFSLMLPADMAVFTRRDGGQSPPDPAVDRLQRRVGNCRLVGGRGKFMLEIAYRHMRGGYIDQPGRWVERGRRPTGAAGGAGGDAHALGRRHGEKVLLW